MFLRRDFLLLVRNVVKVVRFMARTFDKSIVENALIKTFIIDHKS